MREFLYNSKSLGLTENNKLTKRKLLYSRKYLIGLQIYLKGRLKGIKRSKKWINQYGKITPNSIKKLVKINSNPINTKWGIWNLKISLYRSKIK